MEEETNKERLTCAICYDSVTRLKDEDTILFGDITGDERFVCNHCITRTEHIFSCTRPTALKIVQYVDSWKLSDLMRL